MEVGSTCKDQEKNLLLLRMSELQSKLKVNINLLQVAVLAATGTV